MACKTETKEIGDHEYSVTQWPAEKAMLMKLRIVKAFGASLAKIAGQAFGNKAKGEVEAEALSEGLSLLFNSSSPEELVALIKSCVIGVSRDGSKITETRFQEIFSGDELSEIYKIFIFVLQVNYRNFFKGQLAESLLAKAEKL